MTQGREVTPAQGGTMAEPAEQSTRPCENPEFRHQALQRWALALGQLSLMMIGFGYRGTSLPICLGPFQP
jgi:hypothetical protein